MTRSEEFEQFHYRQLVNARMAVASERNDQRKNVHVASPSGWLPSA